MLCTKPCLVKFKGGHSVHEENAIEFQAINQVEDSDRPSINADPGSREGLSSDELVARRQNEIKTLDDQIKKMGKDDAGHHSFGEVFIH